MKHDIYLVSSEATGIRTISLIQPTTVDATTRNLTPHRLADFLIQKGGLNHD